MLFDLQKLFSLVISPLQKISVEEDGIGSPSRNGPGATHIFKAPFSLGIFSVVVISLL